MEIGSFDDSEHYVNIPTDQETLDRACRWWKDQWPGALVEGLGEGEVMVWRAEHFADPEKATEEEAMKNMVQITRWPYRLILIVDPTLAPMAQRCLQHFALDWN